VNNIWMVIGGLFMAFLGGSLYGAHRAVEKNRKKRHLEGAYPYLADSRARILHHEARFYFLYLSAQRGFGASDWAHLLPYFQFVDDNLMKKAMDTDSFTLLVPQVEERIARLEPSMAIVPQEQTA
jgi:hypothetical protein